MCVLVEFLPVYRKKCFLPYRFSVFSLLDSSGPVSLWLVGVEGVMWLEFWLVGWDGLRVISYFHSTWEGFLHEFDIMLRTHFFSDLCIWFWKVSVFMELRLFKYTKGNRIEMGFNPSTARGRRTWIERGCLRVAQGFSFEIRPQFPLGFSLPLSPSSSSLVVDDGTYGTWFEFSYLCSTVLIIVVLSSLTRRRFLRWRNE